jgi:hypothetical protein
MSKQFRQTGCILEAGGVNRKDSGAPVSHVTPEAGGWFTESRAQSPQGIQGE